jgi:hypothetical protein
VLSHAVLAPQVNIMGSDYLDILHRELSEEAIFWIQARQRE